MEIIRTISWMKETVRQARAENHVIGFIPTWVRCMKDTFH